MKKISNFVKLRTRLKAARNLGRIEGELKASGEFQKSLRKLSEQTKVAMIELEGAHESNLKLLTVKEKEFQDGCEGLKKEREKVRNILKNMDRLYSNGMQQVTNVETMLNDEKVNKFVRLDLAKSKIEDSFIFAKKEAEKAGVML